VLFALCDACRHVELRLTEADAAELHCVDLHFGDGSISVCLRLYTWWSVVHMAA